MSVSLDFVDEENMSMFTDFYELTMCASYFDNKKFEPATFDLFIRRLPPNRSYFLFAGLEQVLLFLQKVRFNEEHIDFLKKQGFKNEFLDYLRHFKFTGEVWSIPEGTIAFPNESLIRVTAPIIEAQLIETFILNTVNLQTTIATKASRVVSAAKGRPVIEFGLRREHGTEVRELLDRNGLKYVKIFASGDLDEYKVEELLIEGAKIDAFGVGTKMGTSEDRPYVDIIYKLCEKMNEKGEFSPIMKLSKGKATLPGRKQVFRFKDERSNFVKDVIALEDEKINGEPLLVKVMEKGKIVYDLPSLEKIRKRALESLSKLPDKYKKLKGAPRYPVELSLELKKLMKKLRGKLKKVEVLNPT
jgi:nicotinic acid phosphoribosyltransferase